MKVIEITNVDFSLRQFLLPLMRGIRARGHEVVGVCAEGPLLDDVRAEGFRVVAVPFARRVSPLAHCARLPRAGAAVPRGTPGPRACAHADQRRSSPGWRRGAPACRASPIPATASCSTTAGPWPRRAAGFAMEWLAGRVTDVFLTVSTEEAADARRLRHLRGTRSRSATAAIRRCSAPTRRHARGFARGARRRRRIASWSSRCRGWCAHKGYRELAAAMRDVPDAELWVVGERLESDRGDDMAAMLRDAGLGERLRLLGYRADVAAVLAAADIFVLPSHFEGLPMSVIEAMLTGLPVVATEIRGPREQVVPEVTGLLVPPRPVAPLAAALRRLAGDPALRAAMGEAGRARALELYDEAKVLARTLDLLGA